MAHNQVASGDAATGIYTESQNITFNTTGTINVDCSNSTNYKSKPLRSTGNILTKVGTMTLKYTEGGGVGPSVSFNTGAFVKSMPNATTETYTPGPLPVNLTPGDSKVTLKIPASSETVHGFVYTTSTTSVSAPESGSASPMGAVYISAGASVDITATNGEKIFVQVYKMDGSTLKVYGFGEASATPTAGALTFADSTEFDVPAGMGGTDISPTIDVSGGVSGGTAPYTFSKFSGPMWLKVSSAGIVSGTRPATASGTGMATIEVEDSAGEKKQIVINVGAVTEAPTSTYAVTVVGGTGSDEYEEGDTVTITANTAPEGKVFDKWTTSDGVSFANASSATTTFTMPAKAVTVTANYKDLPSVKYTATVTSGTGGGQYEAGETVTITANTAPEGKEFDKWTTSDGVSFANANSATTTFTMPNKAVTVTATYKDLPPVKYAVTVTSGTGGEYGEGDTVTITANTAPEGKVFDKWTTSDGVSFANASSATTTFTMPNKVVTVTATYKDLPPVKYAVTVTSGTNGVNNEWQKGTGTEIKITSDGDFAKFTGVKVDGEILSTDSYMAKAGSTVITFLPSYLSTLSEGSHTLEILFSDGEVKTTFTVLDAVSAVTDEEDSSGTVKLDETPKTGDNNQILSLLALSLSSMGAMLTTFYSKRKRVK